MSSSGLFDFTLRYQRVPGAQYHVRPLTLLQQEVLYRCDGTVTLADLADATRYSHPEMRAVLAFLAQHGLVKTLPPDPTLFAPMSQAAADALSDLLPGRSQRLLPALKRALRGWLTRLWSLSPRESAEGIERICGIGG